MDSAKPSRAVLLFTRAPKNERKRLASSLAAAQIHTALILRTLSTVARADAHAALVVAIDGELPIRIAQALDALAETGRTVFVVRQRGTDFNSRFLGAMRETAALGYERIVAVGSDTPSFTSNDVDAALFDDRVTLGPSRDGGFYLIGLDAASIDAVDRLPWHRSSLLTALLTRLGSASPLLLNVRSDIDTASQARACWNLLARLVREMLDSDLEQLPMQVPGEATSHAPPPLLNVFENAPHRGPPRPRPFAQ